MAVTQLQVTQLYLAYFGRPPDFDGMNFYLAQSGATVQSVAAAFSASPESQALYGSGFGAAQINAIYQNLFNRDAEPAGLEYWSTQVNTHVLSPAMAAYGIMLGAQNQDAVAVAAKMTVSSNWLAELNTSGEIIGYNGTAAVAVARDYLHTITTAAQAALQTPTVINAKIAESVVAHNTGGLTIAADVTTVNEGATVFFTLQTLGVAAGTEYAYTITGVSAADVVGGQLTGVASIDVNGKAIVAVSLIADGLTDAGENVVLTSSGVVKSIAVNDTSTTPVATYVIANNAPLVSSVSTVNEGATVIYTITTTNVAPGTELNYSLTGTGLTPADVVGGQLTGSVTVGNDGKALVQVTYAADYFGNEGNETVRLNVQTATSDVVVKEVLATYLLEVNRVSVDEGAAVTYTLVTTNVAPGTQVAYAIVLTGATAADIGGVPLTGFTTVGADGRANVVVNATADLTTDAGEKVKVVFNVPTSLINETLTTADVTINDTSVAPTPSYSVTPSASSINEGSTVTFTIQTTNVATGTSIAYDLSGVTASDVGGGAAALTGNAIVGANGQATVTVTLLADQSFGADSDTLVLTLTGKAVTSSVTVVDTSVLQTQFTLTAGQDTITGSAQTDTITAQNATLNAGDILVGGSQASGGADTLRVFVDSAMGVAGANYSGFEMSGIETLEVTSDDLLAGPGNGATFELSSTTGITKLVSNNSSQATTFNQITGLATVELRNLTNPANASVTLQFQDTVVAGLTTLDMNVVNSNVGVVTIGSVGDANGGIETLNLNLSGGASTITTINSDITTLDLNGATVGSAMTNNLTITNSLNATITTITGSDASGFVVLTVAGAAQGVAITTGSGSDTLTGSAFGDTIKAGGGSNVVNSGAGADNVTVGAGSGTQVVLSGTGNDTVVVNTVNSSFVDGDTGSDTITVNGAGGSGTHTVIAGTGDNIVTVTGNGAASITALGGADTITINGTAAGAVSSGAGNDAITATGGGVMVIDAGADNDTVTTGAAADSITIGSGLDAVSAGDGNDIIVAGGNFDASWDFFSLATKQDVINGGDGNDELRVNGSSNLTDTNFNQASSIEILTMQDAGSLTLWGDNSGITNYAQTAGISTINTTTGDDSVEASSFSSALTVNLFGGEDSIGTGAGADTINASGDFNIRDDDSVDGGGGSADVLNLSGDTGSGTVSPTTATALANGLLDGLEIWNLASQGLSTGDLTGNQYNLSVSDANRIDGGLLTVNAGGLLADANGGLAGGAETLKFSALGVTAFNVSVTSGGAADVITDGGGDDFISTDGGTDTITLTAGTNTFDAGSGNDTVTLGSGSDSGAMGTGADKLVANVAGNLSAGDIISGSSAAGASGEIDTLQITDVATGTTDAQYAGLTFFDNLVVDGVVTTTIGTSAQAAGFRNVQLAAAGGSVLDASGFVSGAASGNTTGNLNVLGGTIGDTITTGGGADTVDAGAGNDSVVTGAGNDVVMLGTGDENIDLGSGADVVITTGTDLTVDDSIIGGSEADEVQLNVSGGEADATVNLTNVTGVETFRFTATNGGDRDLLNPDADLSSLTFSGGAANTLTTLTVNAAAITDVADNVTVEWAADVDADYAFNVTGSSGNDVFIKDGGGANNNISIFAGAGDDTMRIAAGDLGANITLDGGTGTDTIQLTGGTLQDDDFVGVSNIENLTGYLAAQLSVTLGAQADRASTTAPASNGTLALTTGAGGSNVLVDPAFNNALTANIGGGSDTINAGASASVVTVVTSAANVTATDVITGGTTASDSARLTADNGTADLTGFSGIETFTVVEGSGLTDDANIGMMISDATFGNIATVSGAQTITVNASALNDASLPLAVLNTPVFLPEGGLNLQAAGVTGTNRFVVTGGTGADTVVTGDGADSVALSSGADLVDTGAGNDTVTGTTGNKTVALGSGTNSVSLTSGNNTITGGAGNDTVTVTTGSNVISLGNGVNTVNQTGSGTGNNSVLGGTGVDTINISSNGANTINTGGGNDVITLTSTTGGTNVITGGAGSDQIHLGGSADVVRYSALGDSFGLAATRDTIFAFNSGFDKIGIDAGILAPGVTTVNFAGNAPTSFEAQLAIALLANDGSADYVYDQALSLVYVDVNDDGVLNGQDLVIHMDSLVGNTLDANDLILVDYTPPAAPAITGVADNFGVTVGNVANGGSTDDASVTVSGTAEANSTIAILRNGTPVATATTTIGGTWTTLVDAAALTNGVNALTAKATDASGNVSAASAAYTVTLDTTAPTLAITDDKSGHGAASEVNIADGTVTYTFEFSETVTGFAIGDVVMTGGTAGAFTAVDGNTYTLVVTPTAGTNGGLLNVSVAGGAATDLVGNPSATFTAVTQNYDTLAPATPTVALANDTNVAADLITSDSALTVGMLEGGTTIAEYNVNGGGWGVYNTGALVQGSNTVLVRQTDQALNPSATASITFTLDTIAPTVVVTDNQAEAIINGADGNVTFTFQFSEDVYNFDMTDLTLTGGALAGTMFTAVDANTYTVEITPTATTDNGTVSLTLNASGAAIDLAGNAFVTGGVATQGYDTDLPIVTVVVTNDTTPPANADIAGYPGAADAVADVITSDPALTVTQDEPNAVTIEYSINGSAYSTTYDTTQLNATGTYLNQVDVRVTDEGGNQTIAMVQFGYDAPLTYLDAVFTPLDNATGVPLAQTLTAVFSENIAFTTGLGATGVQLVDLDNSNSVTAAIVTISGATLTIDPSVALVAGHDYAVIVADGSIEEADSGVDMIGWSSPATWNFTAV